MSELLGILFCLGVLAGAIWLVLTPTPQERATQRVLDELNTDTSTEGER
jgi:hypothetical protein